MTHRRIATTLLIVSVVGFSAVHVLGQSKPAAPKNLRIVSGTKAIAGEKSNDFFDEMQKRPETVFSYSLRDEVQLTKYARHYNPAHATYDSLMDAVRFTLPVNANSLATQVWLPVYMPEKGQTVIIWDWRADANWSNANGLYGHKMFQVRRDKDTIWLEAGIGYMPDGRAMHSRVRVYATVGPNSWVLPKKGFDVTDEVGTVHYNSDSIGPVRSNFASPPTTWARFMFVIEQRPDDQWAHIWYYAAHESRDPVVILDDVQIGLPSKPGNVAGEGRPQHFDFEINSSQKRVGPAVTSYGRNVIVMRNVKNPEKLLRRPIK